MKVEFFKHDIGEDDIQRATEVMRQVFLTTGPQVAEFEQKFSTYLKVPYTIGVTSCTGALHLALLRYGIGPGDEVITTAMTFVASATAIIQAGATPVLVDCCPKSGLMLPKTAEAAITDKTKAIIPVHLYGRMVDMKAFRELADRRSIRIIEDSAHCIEGERDGIRPGQLGDAAAFSFFATKGITCGEGGAITCHTEEEDKWYKTARHHGISKNAIARYGKGFQHWDMDMMGWKYNMYDLQAAMLFGQLQRADNNCEKRRQAVELYRENLSCIEELDFMEAPEKGEKSAHHLFTVLVPKGFSRDEIATQLQAAGIGCTVNYVAIHTLTYIKNNFNYRDEDLPNALEIGRRTLSLPLHPSIRDEEIIHVCQTLKELLEKSA